MKAIAEKREPSLLPKLNSGDSLEYMLSSALGNAKRPDVKADLVRVSIKAELDSGDRAGAVHVLSYANAAELPLPDREVFAFDQYKAALDEGNFHDAWKIGATMRDPKERARIIESSLTKYPKRQGLTKEKRYQLSKTQETWDARERKGFRLHIEDTLKKSAATPNGETDDDLHTLYLYMKQRKDNFGFNPPEGTPDPRNLANRVAQRLIDRTLEQGKTAKALEYAKEAHMPEDYIATLNRKLHPHKFETARAFLQSKIGRKAG